MAYPFIPTSIFRQMEKLGLYEKTIYDLWTNGEHVELSPGFHLLKKKYEGWGEVWMTYVRKDNGEWIVTKVGTRPRR